MNEEFNNEQNVYADPLAQPTPDTYQDPLATQQSVEPQKKKMGTDSVIATIGAVVLVFLVGVLGALICYAGYWLVRTVIKSNMNMALKVILSVIIVIAALALLVSMIVAASVAQASL